MCWGTDTSADSIHPTNFIDFWVRMLSTLSDILPKSTNSSSLMEDEDEIEIKILVENLNAPKLKKINVEKEEGSCKDNDGAEIETE